MLLKGAATGTRAHQNSTKVLYAGFLSTRMTLSPRKNILLMKRSLLTGFDPFCPRPDFGTCGRLLGRAFGKTSVKKPQPSQDSDFISRPYPVISTQRLLKYDHETHLGPHFLHVFQNHVHMPVERLDATKEFPVIAAADEDLRGGRPVNERYSSKRVQRGGALRWMRDIRHSFSMNSRSFSTLPIH